MADKERAGTCLLPISRIKTIMKSSPEVSAISQESLFLIGRATELFVQELALRTMRRGNDKENLDYNDLADIVHKQDTLAFLQDIVPQKVKYKDALAIIEQDKRDFSD